MRGVALLTRVGQCKVITQAGVQVSRAYYILYYRNRRLCIDNLIILLGDSNLSISKAKANNISLRAESVIALGARLFDSLEIAINLITLAPPYSSNKWHNINDFPEPALYLQLME